MLSHAALGTKSRIAAGFDAFKHGPRQIVADDAGNTFHLSNFGFPTQPRGTRLAWLSALDISGELVLLVPFHPATGGNDNRPGSIFASLVDQLFRDDCLEQSAPGNG